MAATESRPKPATVRRQPLQVLSADLQRVLAHLHDPDCAPGAMLYSALGYGPTAEPEAVQLAIIARIEDLQRDPATAGSTRLALWADVLRLRYLLNLTQEETALRLHVSLRSVQRLQRGAAHWLAERIWGEHTAAASPDRTRPLQAVEGATPEWRSQVQQEIASLRQAAPEPTAIVQVELGAAVELQQAQAARHGLTLKLAPVPADLAVAVHPSVLRQTLVMLLGTVVHAAGVGELTISAGYTEGRVTIALEAALGTQSEVADLELVREMLAAEGAELQVTPGPQRTKVQVLLPAVGAVTVLVIDDNPEAAHYYRRCVTGTRYRIVHAAQGRRAVEAARQAAPDVILLDIVLPDADGWEVLARLHGDPQLCHTPIIICSIVREADLASALGAAIYLPKPVHYSDLLRALDRAVAAPGGTRR